MSVTATTMNTSHQPMARHIASLCALALVNAAALAQTTVPAPAASAVKATPRIAAKEPDCVALRQRYRESAACFAPYRTASSAIKAEAFDKCGTPVLDPADKCGPPSTP